MTGQIWTISSRECWEIESNWSLYFIHLVYACQSVTEAGRSPPVRTELYQPTLCLVLVRRQPERGIHHGGWLLLATDMEITSRDYRDVFTPSFSEQQQISLMILWKSVRVLFEAFMLMYNSFPCSEWGLSWEYFTITTHKNNHGLKPSQLPVKTARSDWPYPRVLDTDIILH